MYKRLIFLLAAVSLIFIGSSLGDEILLDEEVIISVNNETGDIASGQIVTEVDTGQEGSGLLDFTGEDVLSLSGEVEEIDPLCLSGEEIGDPLSGENFLASYRLIVSEVYFDGTDEWIEITNIGDADFQGNFTLVGVKSTQLMQSNVVLLAGESKVFGDSLAQLSGNYFIGKTGLSLNLIDTAAINIQLLLSGQTEDVFLVDQYWVNFYNDKKTSFEKVGGISTRVQRAQNNQSGCMINPGVIFTRESFFTDVSFPPSQSSGELQFPVPCVLVNQTKPIKINEIFPGDENYPPYIELAIGEDITITSLSISGDLLQTGIEFSFASGGRKLEKNSFFLISSTGFRNAEGFQSVRDDDFRLGDEGNRLLITIGSGQNRQVMDIVYASGESVGGSLYFDGLSVQCARVFDEIDYFSPGFEQRFLKYISGQTLTKIEYIEILTGNQACPSSGQIPQITGAIEAPIITSGISTDYTIRILAIDYDPEGSDTNNEKITLLASHISGDNTPLDLSKTFRLTVNGTNKTLPYILPMDTPTTFIKTFAFPNSTKDGSEVVVQLTYGDKVFDTYRYNPNKIIPEELLTGDLELTGTLFNLSGLHFSITYVLPNPFGTDTQEEIGIFVSRDEGTGTREKEKGVGEQVQVPSTTYQLPTFQVIDKFDLSKGFSLKVGSRSKKLSGEILVGQENIVVGSLGLVNKMECVSLLYKEIELDKFCYPPPKEGQKIYVSFVDLETVTENDLSILTKLTIKRVGNTLCTNYLGSTIVCKRIPASKAETKTVNEKNLYKGFATFIKNYLMQDWSAIYYDTKLKSYYALLAENKSLIAKGISKVDIYGQMVSVTSIKKQMEVMENTPLVIVAVYEGINALRQK